MGSSLDGPHWVWGKTGASRREIPKIWGCGAGVMWKVGITSVSVDATALRTTLGGGGLLGGRRCRQSRSQSGLICIIIIVVLEIINSLQIIITVQSTIGPI